MDAIIVAARSLHIASALLLFGGLVFALLVATPLRGNQRVPGLAGGLLPRSKGFVYASLILIASLISGAAWVIIEAANMSGLPLSQAVTADNLGLVLTKTLFGRIWIGRFGLFVALSTLLALTVRAANERIKPLLVIAAIFAALYLVTLAWSGHAAAAQASGSKIQLVSDIVHLLAAGAWLGGLPALVAVLRSAQPLDVSAGVVQRFSTLGVISVGAVAISGVGNAWYLVGDVPALIGTSYGHILLLKLALFAAMVALAAINRGWLTPQLLSTNPSSDRALHALRRNATIELALGMMIVLTVGVLGVCVPAAHQSPVWPFDRTLTWQATQQSLGGGLSAIAAATIALIAAAAACRGVMHRNWSLALVGIGVFAAGSATWAALLSVPAYPTTYAIPPERYTTDAIRRGADLYAHHCLVCHGKLGHGDGPASASLPVVPADLAAHGSIHRPGEIYWWIAHGIAGTPMPAFAPGLSDSYIWDLVEFVNAQSDAATAMALSNHAQPWLYAIPAPDFTYEAAGQDQQPLVQAQGNPVTLLVLYTKPLSLPYLRALAAETNAFRAIGLRVIAIPLLEDSGSAQAEVGDKSDIIFPTVRGDVAFAYRMFARRDVDPADAAPVQVAYLIDRQGYVRARWIGIPDSPAASVAEVFDQAELLRRERLRAPRLAGHAHY